MNFERDLYNIAESISGGIMTFIIVDQCLRRYETRPKNMRKLAFCQQILNELNDMPHTDKENIIDTYYKNTLKDALTKNLHRERFSNALLQLSLNTFKSYPDVTKVNILHHIDEQAQFCVTIVEMFDTLSSDVINELNSQFDSNEYEFVTSDPIRPLTRIVVEMQNFTTTHRTDTQEADDEFVLV
jgi:hypothetical protein